MSIVTAYEINLEKAEKLAALSSVIEAQLMKRMGKERATAFWEKNLTAADLRLLIEALTHTLESVAARYRG